MRTYHKRMKNLYSLQRERPSKIIRCEQAYYGLGVENMEGWRVCWINKNLLFQVRGQEESSHQLPTGSQRRIQKLAPISVARFEWNLYEWTKMCITWELNLGLGMFHWSVQLHSRTCGQVSRENCYWGMNGCLYKPWERSFNVCHSWLANSEGSSRFRVPSVQTH